MRCWWSFQATAGDIEERPGAEPVFSLFVRHIIPKNVLLMKMFISISPVLLREGKYRGGQNLSEKSLWPQWSYCEKGRDKKVREKSMGSLQDRPGRNALLKHINTQEQNSLPNSTEITPLKKLWIFVIEECCSVNAVGWVGVCLTVCVGVCPTVCVPCCWSETLFFIVVFWTYQCYSCWNLSDMFYV